MKKNFYFRSVLKRENVLKRNILDLFYSFASYPRLMLEVFIRKNFGERYFTLASAITVAVFLIIFPFIEPSQFLPGRYSNFYSQSSSQSRFWSEYWLWYLFTLAFMVFAFFRWQEVRRNPSVFDFQRFSRHCGDINPIFRNLTIFGKKATPRIAEIYLEPLAFLIPGFLLWLMGQKLGVLLMVSSIFYSLGYAAAYRFGDHFVMDKIDEMIMNEELENAFVNDADPRETRGVKFYTRKPDSKEMRERLAKTFLDDDSATAS